MIVNTPSIKQYRELIKLTAYHNTENRPVVSDGAAVGNTGFGTDSPFDGNGFFLRQLRLLFLLRDMQRQHTVRQLCFDILLGDVFANVKAAAQAACVALLTDDLTGLFILFILVKAFGRGNGQIPVFQAGSTSSLWKPGSSTSTS